MTEVTYYRWRSEYGGMKLDQVKRLKELEVENARLRKVGGGLNAGRYGYRRITALLNEAGWGVSVSRVARI